MWRHRCSNRRLDKQYCSCCNARPASSGSSSYICAGISQKESRKLKSITGISQASALASHTNNRHWGACRASHVWLAMQHAWTLGWHNASHAPWVDTEAVQCQPCTMNTTNVRKTIKCHHLGFAFFPWGCLKLAGYEMNASIIFCTFCLNGHGVHRSQLLMLKASVWECTFLLLVVITICKFLENKIVLWKEF